MKKLLLSLLFAALFGPGAGAVVIEATVVADCSSIGYTFTAGTDHPFLMNTAGLICMNSIGGGGSGGSVTQGTSPWVVSGAAGAALGLDSTLSTINTSLGTINTTLGTPMKSTGGTVGLVAGTAAIGTITPQLASFTDKSGAITAGGTSQTLAAINTVRKRILIVNPCTATSQNIATAESLFINFTSAASPTAGGSVELAPCGSYDSGAGPVTTELIAVNAATTAHKWTAKEQ
jgi:hypothetical protein